MNITRIAVPALGAAGLIAAGLGALPAQAADPAPRAAAVNACDISIVSVKALDLQEDRQGTDEVFLRLGDSRTTQRNYFEGQKRNTLGDGGDVFVTSEHVRLLEHDGPGDNDVIDSASLPCQNASGESTLTDAAGDAIYTVTWDVDVLP